MRVLITGAAGRVGSELIKYIGSEHDVIGTFRPTQREFPVACGTAVRVDLAEAEPVAEMLTVQNPDLVIHSAAATSVDRCEIDPDYAQLGNVVTTRNLLKGMEDLGKGRLIYISTDYVFSGETGSPNEDDEPDPINVYGMTKLEGEELVRAADLPSTIIRVCALYTAQPHPKGDPVSSIYETLKDKKPYQAATDLYSNPTEVSDLARAVASLIKLDQLPELLHVAAAEYISRHAFAVKVAQRLKLDKSLVEPVNAGDLRLPAPRPLKAGLNSDRFEELLGYRLKSIEDLPHLTR